MPLSHCVDNHRGGGVEAYASLYDLMGPAQTDSVFETESV